MIYHERESNSGVDAGTCAALMSSLLSTGRIHKSCILDYESLKVFVFLCFVLRLAAQSIVVIKY